MKAITTFMTVLVLAGWAGSAKAVPITFEFAFDGVFDGIPLELPTVGTGQVSFEDVGNGQFSLTALTNLSMQFFVLGQVFTLADAQTPLGQVLAVVSDFGSDRRFQFSNTNGFGTGPYFGSIDFANAQGNYLTFQPPAFGTGLDLYYMGDSVNPASGSYLATSAVPLPGTLAIFPIGLVCLMLARRGPCRMRRIHGRRHALMRIV